MGTLYQKSHLGAEPGSKVPFNATAHPFTNAGRAATWKGPQGHFQGHHSASNRTPADWHNRTDQNTTHAHNMHNHTEDLMDLSQKTHQTTLNNNIAQYQAVNDSFSTKCAMSKGLVDVLDERI